MTVLIDTYNHERFIEQAVSSVLEQDAGPAEMEVLVVDDGSTDNTPVLLRKFEPRVRYIRKENGGQASAFNAGIPEARGEIVAFLDGDDWWEKDKLRSVLDAFEKHPEVGAVGHGLFLVDATGSRKDCIVPDRCYSSFLSNVEEGLQFRELRSFLGTSRLAVRKAVLERVLPVPEALVVEADEFLATVAVALAGAIVLDQALTSYRLHSANLYQFQAQDPVRSRRKYNALSCLLRELPPRLEALRVPPEAIEAILEPNRIDAERLRLFLDGGKPWETVRVERAAFRLAYRDANPGYHLFRALVLVLASLVPPRQFYQLRYWYSVKGLRRFRKFAGEPTPAETIVRKWREVAPSNR